MKRCRILLSVFLAAVMLAATSVPCMAADTDGGFTDVSPGSWYADSVLFCRDNGLMSGTGNGRFTPDGTASRAMLVTVLYRQVGSPAVDSAASFRDVPAGAYYADAVSWGESTGLVGGYGNGLFGSDDPVTRQDLASFLWRAEGRPEAGQAQTFADAAEICKMPFPPKYLFSKRGDFL